MKKLVKVTYPGIFDYNGVNVTQTKESFEDINNLFLGLKVQIGHADNAQAVGKITKVVSSEANHIFCEIETQEDYPQIAVSLGYYSDSKETDEGYLLLGKIMPYHLALVDNPRKTDCFFDYYPQYHHLKKIMTSLPQLQNDATIDAAECIQLTMNALVFLETQLGLTFSDILAYASVNQNYTDVLLGELSAALNLATDLDPVDILKSVPANTTDSKYIPGNLAKSLKDKAFSAPKSKIQTSQATTLVSKYTILK